MSLTMGGHAFNSRGLSTPRMPPNVYYQVLEEARSKLQTIYARAETTIEGPAKTDHGDIDILVVPHDDRKVPTNEEIAKLLGAIDYVRTPEAKTTHFAVPWPEDVKESDVTNSTGIDTTQSIVKAHNNPSEEQPRYIQIDVNLSSTMSQWRYALFQNSHGDIGTILGAIIRRHNLISTPTGLYIQISELRTWNKKHSRVLLSDDPDTVLHYLGLDPTIYWRPFPTWDSALTYASSTRFNDPRHGQELDSQHDQKMKFDKVKHHDRSKAHKRPMFRYWLQEFLPSHRTDLPVGSASHLTETEVIDDAKNFFGEPFTSEFDRRRETGMRTMNNEKFWSDVRKSLPCRGSDKTVTLRGLKLQIIGSDNDNDDGNVDVDVEIQKAYSEERYADVLVWVKENWAVVKERQERRDRAKSSAKLREHLAKLRLEEVVVESENKNENENENESVEAV